jgi:sialic acid synthase SpsE
MPHTYVIAEMAYSHDGSVALAQTIVNAAADAGADAVSIHITHMPDYMVRHYGSGPGRVSAGKEERSIYDYLVEISLSFEDWKRVAQTAAERGLDVIIMPNDGASLTFAETLEPAAFVISAAAFEELEFVDRIGSTGRPVYLRVGGATLGEIETVVERLRSTGNERITLLYGHQNYPTKVADTNLLFLTCLADTFGLPVGIADHIDADDDFAMIAPLLAIPLGVAVIEKHVTHDRGLRGEDFESALGPAELATFIARVRKAEAALGRRYAVGLSESSRAYRVNSRKRLVAARDIMPGETLDAGSVIAKRSDSGLSPARRGEVVGTRARRAIARDEGIEPPMVDPS